MSEGKVWLGILALLVVLYVIGQAGFGDARGESLYTGYVVDTEVDKGVIFRTTTVHLKTNLDASSVESFCVKPEPEEDLLENLQEHQRNQDKVQIEYSRPYWVSPFGCSSGLSLVRDASTASGGAAP